MLRFFVRAGSITLICSIGLIGLMIFAGGLMPSAQLTYMTLPDDANPGVYLIDVDRGARVRLDDELYLSPPSWSPAGDRYAVGVNSATDSGDILLRWVRGGDVLNLTGDAEATDGAPDWSPDGVRIAFVSNRNGLNDVYVIGLDEASPRNLTAFRANDLTPSWSPDGAYITFASDRTGYSDIYIIRPDGTELRNLTNHWRQDTSPVWSPDGTRIAFVSDRMRFNDIHVLNLETGAINNLTRYAANDFAPAWSPDGRQIAFTSTRDGTAAVYVMNADGSDTRRLAVGYGSSWRR